MYAPTGWKTSAARINDKRHLNFKRNIPWEGTLEGGVFIGYNHPHWYKLFYIIIINPLKLADSVSPLGEMDELKAQKMGSY